MTLLEQSRELLGRALLMKMGHARGDEPECVTIAARCGEKQLMKMAALLRQRREDCDFNAGVGLVLGSLAAELEEIL